MSFTILKSIRAAMVGLLLVALTNSAATAETALSAQLSFDSDTGEIRVVFQDGSQDPPKVDWLLSTGEVGVYAGRVPALDDSLKTAAWSKSASYIAGNNWLPKQVLARYDVTVVVNADDQVAVTGTILENRINAGKRHLRFTFEGASDQLMILIGQYEVAERQVGDLVIRTYFDAQNADLSERYLAATETYIGHFEQQIGAYPYQSYSIVAAPIPVGLGFAGLTYVGRDLLSHDYMSQRSLAHEILHSWWGNAVRVDYARGNWSEGLTTYMADYAIGTDGDPAQEAAMRRGWIRQLDAMPRQDMTPLRDFVAASHQQNQSEGYGKAAMVFHQLRLQLGETGFLEGLRGFYRAQQGKQADWAALQMAFETARGADLGWFFDQWIDRAGLPDIALVSAETTPQGAQLVLRQSTPPYVLDVPVVLETTKGPVHVTLRLSQKEQRFDIAVADPALSLQIDPGFDMLRRPAPKELAPTLGLAFNTDDFDASVAVATQTEAAKLRQAVAEMLPDHNLIWEADSSKDLSRLVIGTTDRVAEVVTENFAEVPDFIRAGAARAWIDYDQDGLMWFFMSADNLDDLRAEMAYLGYYSSRGFVVFENGRGKRSGTPASRVTPLMRRFQ